MLRILVINEVSPQIKNRTSIIFEKIVPIISKKNNIKIFWLSYDYKKNQKTTESWYKLLHVHEFKNAKDVRETVNATPMCKFMLETDSPFLAPAPHRSKRCEPSFTRHIAGVVAEVKGVSLDELSESTCATAHSFFPKLKLS